MQFKQTSITNCNPLSPYPFNLLCLSLSLPFSLPLSFLLSDSLSLIHTFSHSHSLCLSLSLYFCLSRRTYLTETVSLFTRNPSRTLIRSTPLSYIVRAKAGVRPFLSYGRITSRNFYNLYHHKSTLFTLYHIMS